MTSMPPPPPEYPDGGMPPGSPYGGGMPGMPGGPAPLDVPRPRPVQLAVQLMYAGAVLQFLGGLSGLLQDRSSLRAEVQRQLESSGNSQVTPGMVDAAVTVGVWAPVVLGVILAGVWVLMAVFNGRGRNWARITATVLGGVNILSTGVSLVGTSIAGVSRSSMSLLLALVALAVAISVIVLLWRRESSAYFAARSGPRVGY